MNEQDAEREFLMNSQDAFVIYQLKLGEEARDLRFEGYNHLRRAVERETRLISMIVSMVTESFFLISLSMFCQRCSLTISVLYFCFVTSEEASRWLVAMILTPVPRISAMTISPAATGSGG